MFERALVVSASIGAGHRRAAEAMVQALEVTGAARSIRHLDMLTLSAAPFRYLYQTIYTRAGRYLPGPLKSLYEMSDKPWAKDWPRLPIERFSNRRYLRLLESEQPDLLVCTHFTPAAVAGWLKRQGRLRSTLAITVTDFLPHAMWFCRDYDHYFVARDEARHYMAHHGIDPARLHATGIPVDPGFASLPQTASARRELELDTDLTTIVYSAGGSRPDFVERAARELLKMPGPAQVVFIAGGLPETQRRLARLAERTRSNLRVSVVGFTDRMHLYMAAADLFISKPGGLTTSEILASGRPMVVIDPIPGQEDLNADYLLEEGVAIRVSHLATLTYKVDRLLKQPERLATMRANAQRIGHPRSALDVVAILTAERDRATPADPTTLRIEQLHTSQEPPDSPPRNGRTQNATAPGSS